MHKSFEHDCNPSFLNLPQNNGSFLSKSETIILNLDDLVNNLMLETVLSINDQKPKESIDQLNSLFQSKAALNTVMKYLDSQ